MTLAFQWNHSRHCSRCNTPLEDPASEERGIGPICAKKGTALFAKAIPANYAGATALLMPFLSVNGMLDIPVETHPRLEALVHRVITLASLSAKENSDIQQIGQDLRPVIKEVDWLLSHKISQSSRKILVRVVRFLGYVELAAVLSQEASTTSANLWFQDGRVFLKGKSCKPGFLAIRSILGSRLPRYRGSEEPYSVPAQKAEAFLEAVINHWPFYQVTNPDQSVIEGAGLHTIRQMAQEWVQKALEQFNRAIAPTMLTKPSTGLAEPILAGRVATIQSVSLAGTAQSRSALSNAGNVLEVSFKWISEKTPAMYVMVGKLKEIPTNERSHDPKTKNWFFLPKHKQFVIDTLSKMFIVQESKETSENERQHT